METTLGLRPPQEQEPAIIFCPLVTDSVEPCRKNCGWFDDEVGMCAILVIAKSLKKREQLFRGIEP